MSIMSYTVIGKCFLKQIKLLFLAFPTKICISVKRKTTELKYTADHAWIRLEGDIATVGITDFAQEQLSDIVYVEVETVGSTLAKDTIFGTVEAIKTISDLFIPMSGEVLTFHEALIKKPEMVNTDPYGEGWMIQIKITTPEEWNSLLSASDYQKLINA